MLFFLKILRMLLIYCLKTTAVQKTGYQTDLMSNSNSITN